MPIEEYLANHDAILESLFNPPPVEELLPKIPPLVSEVMELLRKYAVPYFQRVAEKNGQPPIT